MQKTLLLAFLLVACFAIGAASFIDQPQVTQENEPTFQLSPKPTSLIIDPASAFLLGKNNTEEYEIRSK